MNKLFKALKSLHIRIQIWSKVNKTIGKVRFNFGLALSNYGEQFAANCLRKFYAKAVTPVITNSDYEGDIKKKGNVLNILSFLDDITLTDYSVGSDMNLQRPVDTEDTLTIDQKKYYNFDIDSVDKQFTYVEDEDSTLIENASKALEKGIDTFILKKVLDVKAGHRVGADYTVVGDGDTVKITVVGTTGVATLVAPTGTGMEDSMIGKGMVIGTIGATPTWYRISAVSSTLGCTLTTWSGKDYPAATDLGGSGYGFVVEADNATQVTSSNVYDFICDLREDLNEDSIPDTDRHLTVPPWFLTLLTKASELQPDIAIYHEEVIRNGKVGRVAGFDIHEIPSNRIFSTIGTDSVSGYCILANHTGFITFAHKWSESRVIDAEKQFARLYQGLNLYGAEVTTERRKAGAMLFAKA